MNNITQLKYPPIKSLLQKKMPKELVYCTNEKFCGIAASDTFYIFSTKNPKNFCKMTCLPDTIEREGIKGVSLYIWKLISNVSGKGLGTKMLDFAQVHSKKIGCNGFFHLTASCAYTPHKIPHVFYKKYGMTSNDQKIDRKLDKLIKKKKFGTYLQFQNIDFYYPPLNKKDGKLASLIKGIKDIF